MGLDLGAISADVRLKTAALASDVVKAKAMFSGLDKSMSGGMKNTEKGLAGLASKLKNLGNVPGSATNVLGTVGSQISALGKVGFAVGGLVAIGAAGIAAAMNVGKGFRLLQQETGVTGVAAVQLGKDYRAALLNVPNTAEEVGRTMGALAIRTGLVGKPLSDLTDKILNLARISGSDAVEAGKSLTGAMSNWGIAAKDQGPKLDYLYGVTTKTTTGLMALSDGMAKYGPQMRGFGLSFEESAAMVGLFAKNGIQAQQVMMGMRTGLAKIAKDAGDPKALNTLITGMRLTGQAAKEAGTALKTPATALPFLVDQIKNASDSTEALNIATQLFGARGGPALADAIRNGRFELGPLLKELESSPASIDKVANSTMSLSQRFDRLKNALALAAEPIGQALLPAIANALDAMAKWDWSKIIGGVQGAVTTAVNTIKSIWSVLDTLKIPAALTAFAHTLADLASAWNEAFGPSKADGTFKQSVDYKAAGYAEIDKAASAHLPNISKLNKKMLQDASNTLIGEVPVFQANAMGLMDAVNAAIRSTDLKGATREKIASMAQGISDATGLPVANIQALLDQLAGKITATDLRTPTGQTMKQMVKGISDITGLGVAEIGTLLTQIKGRVSAEDLAGASQEMINTMAKGISDATGYDEESIRRLLTVLSQTTGSFTLLGPNIGPPTVTDPTPTIQTVVDNIKGFFSGNPTHPVVATPTVTDPIPTAQNVWSNIQGFFLGNQTHPQVGEAEGATSSAQGAWSAIQGFFSGNPVTPTVGPANTNNPGIMSWATNAQAGEHVAKEVIGGMQGTFAANMTHPVVGGASGGSAMSDLASATALANASFGNFISAMTAEPFNEVNDAIFRMTNQNSSSLGDWWKLRGAYNAATEELAAYTEEITSAEKAVTSLEGKIEKANAARDAAHDRPSLLMDKQSNELQLKIMKAEDAHNYALAAKLTLQNETLDRKKEELDLTTSIADQAKEIKDNPLMKDVKGKVMTVAQIDTLIAKYAGQLSAKEKEVAALKVTFDKVQTSVDAFKKIIDDLSGYMVKLADASIAAEEAAKAADKQAHPERYAEGTSYVPRTGMALVHQGEAIIPANLNPLVLGRGGDTLITVPLYLDGKLIAKSVSRYQGGQANSRAMSGGRY